MKLAKLLVRSGWHERDWCPVETELELDEAVDLEHLVLWHVDDGLAVPVQAWRRANGKIGLSWIVAGGQFIDDDG